MRFLGIVLSIFLVLFLMSGCATTGKSANLEAQGLRNQIALLDAQIQAKDEEINNLKERLAKDEQDIQAQAKVKEINLENSQPVVFVRPSVKQVQAVDPCGDTFRSALFSWACKGPATTRAANNLSAKGKINRKTWELLKVYLDKKPVQSGIVSNNEIG
ncbi:MAG: hypothetical protein NT033_02880 [Candidatus Omnitrophica bacterium]|nr:hypothetical protein [Candidatus Omnitrophota bacterium]